MLNNFHKIALLHYSAPPVIGGVENVIRAHVRMFIKTGYPVAVLAGRGEQDALPLEAELIPIPKLDSQNPEILEASQELNQGQVPSHFDKMITQLMAELSPALESIDILIVHNVFTKHFNLPLTAALCRLLDAGIIRHCVAWCHDMTWTSPNSRQKVYPGYPWDLLRTHRPDLIYVTVSKERQRELADLFGCQPEHIHVIYNGVNPSELLALSDEGLALIERLDLWESDLNILMPVRITQAKNIELGLRVVAALKKRGVNPRLVVTGPPDPHDRTNMQYFQSLLILRAQLELADHLRFVYESGTTSDEPLMIDVPLVTELLRVSDVLFMPSHREGFGMPVLEAGLVSIPVFCADTVPAANEIGSQDLVRFSPEAHPEQVADLILKRLEDNSVFRLRKCVRQNLTWDSIFRQRILPLLDGVLL